MEWPEQNLDYYNQLWTSCLLQVNKWLSLVCCQLPCKMSPLLYKYKQGDQKGKPNKKPIQNKTIEETYFVTHQLNLQRPKWFSVKPGYLLQGRINSHVSSQSVEKIHASCAFLLTHLNMERLFGWTQFTSGGFFWMFQTNERAKTVQLLTEGSSEIILTVLSTSPTARNRERC